MRVLVLCGDYFHPGQAARAGFGLLTGEDFEFDWVDDVVGWSPDELEKYPVVVLTKSNHTSATNKTPWMTPAVEAAFHDYVSRGNGLLAIHSGTADYAKAPILRKLLGGVFTHHPAQCPVTIETEAGHLLSVEKGSFSVFDEHYFMDTEPGNDVFLLTESENGVQPGGWTRQEGQGRICALTPGHNPEVWLNPDYQTLLRRALVWTGGVKDKAVSADS